MAFTQPTADTYTVEKIVGEARKGTIRIPYFQRAFKWNRRDTQLLLDSLLKGYPIGNFLLWKRPAPEGSVTLGQLTIDAPDLTDALWVVDGQQRITTLVNVLSEEGQTDPRFRFTFDPQNNAITSESRHIPFHILMNSSRLLAWIRENVEQEPYVDQLLSANSQLREYKVPVYIVDAEEPVLRDIFYRMNNYGRAMSRSEVFHALHISQPGEHSISAKDLAPRLNAQTDFGLVDEDTALKALFAIRGPNVSRRLETEFTTEGRDFSSDTESKASERTLDALVKSAHFLVRDARIPHFALLPYRYLLVVLARFFAHHPNDLAARQRILLRRWVWQAVNTHGVGFNSYNATTQKYAGCIAAGQSADTSIAHLLQLPESVPPEAIPKHVNSSISKMLLCAMWEKGPRSITPNEVKIGPSYSSTALAEALGDKGTINNALVKLRGAWGAHLGNRTFFLESEAEQTALFEQPATMEADEWLQLLASHALTPEIVKESTELGFVSARNEILFSWLKDFYLRMAEPQTDNTPSLHSLDLDNQ